MDRIPPMQAALVCAALFAPHPAVAAEEPAAEAERPRIGLVLSGGGARGAAHAGILELLEHHRVPVDVIVGTSIGALVGSYYASGMSPEEIVEWLERLDWQAAATDRPPRRATSFRRKQADHTHALAPQVGFREGHFILPRGLLAGHELGYRLRTATLHTARWRRFDDFPIPFRAVAADIERGERVVLDHGPLGDALLASMAVPGVVAPIEIDGRWLLDGGLVDNLPVDVARDLGAEVIIAVDVGRALGPRDELQDILGISIQVMTMVGRRRVQAAIESLGPDDVLIQPDMEGIKVGDFELMDAAIERGRAIGPEISARLARYSVDEASWAAWLERHRRAGREWPVIGFVDLHNPSPVADALIEARISLRTGERLTRRELRRNIDTIYSIGEFDRVDFDLVERDGETGLDISVMPRLIGPNYLRFGLSFEDDFSGGSAYRFQFMHTRTRLNALNGEWRNEIQFGKTLGAATELFQPLTWAGGVFINPGIAVTRTEIDLFDGGRRSARYSLHRGGFSLDAGLHRRNYGEARIGVFREEIDADPRIGAQGLPRFDERVAGLHWRFTLDQLDDFWFPTAGWWVSLGGRHGLERLGGQRRFGRVELSALTAQPLTERHIIRVGILGGARTTGTLPFYDQFALGGLMALSGLHLDELRGDYMFLARIGWSRRMGQLPTGLGEDVRVGLSHERGNVWDARDDVRIGDLRHGSAVYLGADMAFGALYLGAGRADNGDMSMYLYLQRSFL